ncbi:MAG: peptidylprolyl isomerase [Hyphomicrobiales bacterium]
MRKVQSSVLFNVKNSIKAAALSTAFICIALSSQAQKVKDKDVLLDFGKEKVTAKEFLDVYKENNLHEGVIDKKSVDEYLDLYINFKLKVKEARNLGYDTIASYVDEIKGYRDQLAKPYFIDQDVNEELLKEAYNRMLQDVRASHIMVKLDENASPADTLAAYNKIMEIRQKVLAGGDFGKLAAEFSDDPSAKDREEIPGRRPFVPGNEGDLGYFTVFDMVYPFETAAYNTPVGEISMPVRTQFGYHILKIDKRDKALGVAEVAHIYVAARSGASKEDSLAAAEKINQIYEKLEGGMPWNEAVKKYSEDKASAAKNGILPKFKSNRMPAQFIEATKELTSDNNISKPIHSIFGWHILKLENITAPGSYDEELPKLKERLTRDVRNHKSEKAVINQIKKENKFKAYKKNIEKLYTALEADTTLLLGMIEAKNYQDYKAPIYRFAKKKYLQKDFVAYLAANQKGKTEQDARTYLSNLYNEFIDKFVLDYENKHLEDKYPDFAKLMDKYKDGILLFNLSDKKIWSAAASDTTGLKEFYEAHKGDYMWNKRVDAMVVTVKNPELVDKAREIASKLDTADTLRKALKANDIDASVIQKNFEKGSNGYVDSVDWIKGLSKNFEGELGNSVVFVKVVDVLEPMSKKLNEARGTITADYQDFLEKKWISDLRDKYSVTINKKALEEIKK